MDLSINFDFFDNFLNLYSNPYPIIKKFCCILNNLIQNLQKICEIPKPKHKTLILKKLKTQTKTLTFGFYWLHMSELILFNL